MAAHHLAQLNIARLLAPLESPQLSGFVEALEPINELAERSPGFVWRLQTDEGDATAIRPFDDDWIMVNMSVWESVEALSDFAYRSDHRPVMVRRREWFERMREAYQVLWWVPAGHRPSVEEAKERLLLLREKGPSPEAFTFQHAFPAPDEASTLDGSGADHVLDGATLQQSADRAVPDPGTSAGATTDHAPNAAAARQSADSPVQ